MTVTTNISLPLPAPVGTALQTLVSDTQEAMLNAGGVVADLTTADLTQIESDAAAVNSAAAPYIAGLDATLASPALDAQNNADSIAIIAVVPEDSPTQLTVINPNFFALACQYLGDATLWQSITDLSGLQPDPQPLGQFKILIPAT